MKTKNLAYFFLYLISCNYFFGLVSASCCDPPRPCCRTRRQTGCQITSRWETKLNNVIERCRNEFPEHHRFEDQPLEDGYELQQVMVTGLKNINWSFRCSCGRDLVRIFVKISFLRILISCVLVLVEELLGGLLGPLGSALARTVGNVVNLVIRILSLDIIVELSILQRFVPGARCVLEWFRVSRVVTIKLLGLDLAFLAEILSPILTPIVNSLCQSILQGRIRESLRRHIEELVIPRSAVSC